MFKNKTKMRCLEVFFLLISCTGLRFASVKTLCADGWLAFQGSCYLFGHDAVHFTEAEHFCRQHETSHLVHVNNQLENNFIKDKLREFPAKSWWIGMTDEAIEGVWKWFDTDETLNFTDWGPNQPESSLEDCGVLYAPFDFKWGDIACTTNLYPVCETKASPCGESEIIG